MTYWIVKTEDHEKQFRPGYKCVEHPTHAAASAVAEKLAAKFRKGMRVVRVDTDETGALVESLEAFYPYEVEPQEPTPSLAFEEDNLPF
jgi:hypothetical protein